MLMEESLVLDTIHTVMTLQVSVSTCPLDAMERPLFRDTSSGPNRRRFGLLQGPSSFAGWLYEPWMELWATATV